MRYGFKLLFGLWLSVVVPAHAQPGQLLFHHLRIQDGLSQGDNAYVYKDSRGFVWISSVNGLNRFDGTGIKVYAPNINDPKAMLGENVQSNFFEDQEGDLWFTTYDALNEYSWSEDCFNYFQASPNGKTNIGYHIFHLDQMQNLWLLIQDSFIYTFNLDQHVFNLVANIHQIANRAIAFEDERGRVKELFAYVKGGTRISRVILEENQTGTVQDSFQPDPLLTECWKMVSEGDSVLWIQASKYLLRYNLYGDHKKLFPLSIDNAVTSEWLNQSTLLIGTNKKGLYEFDIDKGIFTHQYLQQRQNDLSLQSNSIEYINRDRDGVIWISTIGIGVSYAYPQKKKFTTKPVVLETIEENDFIPLGFFPANENRIWCPTPLDGFFEVNRSSNDLQLIPVADLSSQAMPGELFAAFPDTENRLWLSTFDGLGVLNLSNHTIYRIIENPGFFYTGVPDTYGRIILSGNVKGIQRTTGNWKEGFTIQPYNGIPDTSQYLILNLDSKGRLWLNDNLQKVVVYDTVDFGTLAILPITGIGYQMLESPGDSVAWITSSSGLYKVNTETIRIERIYNQHNKLPSSWFSAMEMDPQGRLWIAYNQGILMFDPKTEVCRAYTSDDGLSQLEYQNSSLQLSNGEMWFGAVNAITYFSPGDIKDIDIPAHPQISEIQVNDRVPADLICELNGSRNPTEIRKLTFNYLNNTLSFKVHSLEYSAPAQNTVQYRLKDLDDHFLETKSGTVIRYPNLPFGDYQLILHAINSDGVLNPVAHVVDIRVKPPFYRTWWFYILVFVVLASIAGYIIYLRFTKALELQRVRFKLYENLHDDVGSRLTAIVLTAEELEKRHAFTNPKLHSISQIAKSIVGNMRRLVWAIDPENDKMNNVIQKITYDKSLMLSDDIALQVEADEATRNLTVPGELRYQISSICNEALNNISKYAKATKVIIRMSMRHGKILLTIQDNGVGFKVDEKSKNATTGSGYGLNNMKRRASRVKGTLEIYSNPGEGTRIEGVFPL